MSGKSFLIVFNYTVPATIIGTHYKDYKIVRTNPPFVKVASSNTEKKKNSSFI